MSALAAADVWSQQSVPQRRLLIEKLQGNADEAENDWAALSPQLKTALMAAMFPPSDQPAVEEEENDGPHRRTPAHRKR